MPIEQARTSKKRILIGALAGFIIWFVIRVVLWIFDSLGHDSMLYALLMLPSLPVLIGYGFLEESVPFFSSLGGPLIDHLLTIFSGFVYVLTGAVIGWTGRKIPASRFYIYLVVLIVILLIVLGAFGYFLFNGFSFRSTYQP